VPLALFLGELIMVVAVYAWARKQLVRLGPPLGFREALGILRKSAPIGGAQILRAVALGSDLVIVGSMLSLVEAGHYAAAYKMFQFGISSVTLYMITVFPRIAHVAEAKAGQLSHELRSSTLLILSIGIPATLLTGWLADDVLGLLFGHEFVAATDAFRIMLATILVFAATAHLRSSLIGLNLQIYDAAAAGVASLVHIVAKVSLATPFGMEGVALGGLIGEVAFLSVSGIVYARWARANADGRSHQTPPRS
jgi:O-antigen/teichoic acid export membrane protein